MLSRLKKLFGKKKKPEDVSSYTNKPMMLPLTVQQKIYLGRVRLHLLKVQTDFHQKDLPVYVRQIQTDINKIDKILRDEHYYQTQQEWLNGLQNVINPY